MMTRFHWPVWLCLFFTMLALHASEPSVSAVLADGKGDFDPWNQTRWAAWYLDGRLVKPFEIDTSVRFAAREGPWEIDVSGLKTAGVLLVVRRPGLMIDGNGVVIDATAEPFRARTLDQLYRSSEKERTDSMPLKRGIAFRVPFTEGVAQTRLINFTLIGCVMGGLAARENTHPLQIEYCTFSRNSTGFYVAGTGLTVRDCAFFENAVGAFYNGGGGHGNRFEKNVFRDNNYRGSPSYADIILDTSYGNTIADNRFLPSLASAPHFRAAFSFFRNAGEENQLREDFPRENHIVGNHIDGYTIGIHVGSRHGRQIHDLSKEGQDYASDNLLENNTISNTDIGIKVNTSGNTIAGNRFEQVRLPIVLQCVMYSLVSTTIRDEPGVPVALWMAPADISIGKQWEKWMGFAEVPPEEKLVQIHSDGSAVIAQPSAGVLLEHASLLTSKAMTGLHGKGPRPMGVAVGDFYDNQAGAEAAVIWDGPSLRRKGVDYYDIIFYDADGTEINRSARSTAKWGGIVAGNFSRWRGDEIIAFAEEPVNGKYPIYLFRRGRAKPDKVFFADNPRKIRGLAAGNFDPSDALDEVAVIFADGSTDMVYLNPRNPEWSATTASPVALAGIVGGKFSLSLPGDQVAAIGAATDAPSGTWPIYFFATGSDAPFEKALQESAQPWTAIGAGRFDPAASGDTVAVANAVADEGIYRIVCARLGDATAFKTIASPVVGAPVRALAGGTPRLRENGSAYERAEGDVLQNDVGAIQAWGDSVVVLPEREQSGAIPLFWLNAAPAPQAGTHLKVTPILR